LARASSLAASGPAPAAQHSHGTARHSTGQVG
jgi:hypothetical protein